MKIGIDVRLVGKQRTGDEAVFLGLVHALAKIDTTNEYFLLTDTVEPAKLQMLAERLQIRGKNNFHLVGLKCSNRYMWNFWVLARYLRQNPVAVFHTQYITPWLVSRKIKIVTIIHDLSFVRFPQLIKWSDRLFLNLLIPLSIRRADRVVAVSDFTKQELIDCYGVAPEKVVVIKNALAEEYLNQVVNENDLAQIRSKYGLPERYVLYLGTLQPRKNVAWLIGEFATLRQKFPELKLVLAGSRTGHNFDSQIDQAIAAHALQEAVIFTGYIDEQEKKMLYQDATVFVFPSKYEGFGIPLLEAFAANVPVVAVNIPVLREVAGDAAMYVKLKESGGLQTAIEKLLNDQELAEKLKVKGRARLAEFSWQKAAELTLAMDRKIGDNNKD